MIEVVNGVCVAGDEHLRQTLEKIYLARYQ